MAEISKITLPSGTTYDIKDATARSLIDGLSGYTDFLGITTTALTDGATTNPITVNNQSVTARQGNITTYGSAEFIFNGTAWQAFGDLSGLGSLAYKNSASGSFTPAGSVSQPTFSGTAKYLGVSVGTASKTMTGNFTPAGTVSQPTFTGDAGTVSVSGTASGSVATTYNSTSSGANGNFTPAGTVSTPTITVTPTTESIYQITGVGTVPAWSATVSNETLTISWSAGSVPTRASKTVATGITSATSSQPTFTGTKIYAHHTFTGTANTSTGSFTPEGTVSQPTFSGTQGSVSVSGTIANSASLTAYTSSATGRVDITPAGTVSQPTFSGTQGNISVS